MQPSRINQEVTRSPFRGDPGFRYSNVTVSPARIKSVPVPFGQIPISTVGMLQVGQPLGNSMTNQFSLQGPSLIVQQQQQQQSHQHPTMQHSQQMHSQPQQHQGSQQSSQQQPSLTLHQNRNEVQGQTVHQSLPPSQIAGQNQASLSQQLSAGGGSVMPDRVNVLLRENEKLNSLLGEKEREAEQAKGILRSYEQKQKEDHQELKDLKEKLALLLKENKNLNDALEDKQTYEVGVAQKYEEKLSALVLENDRLDQVFRDQRQECEAWRSKYHELKRQNTDITQQLLEFDLLKEQIEDLEKKIKLLIDENERLNLLSMDKDEKIEELLGLENKIELILNENTKLTSEISRRGNIIEEYKKEIEKLKDHLMVSSEEGQRINYEFQRLESHVSETNEKFARIIEITEMLNDLVAEKQDKIDKLSKEIIQYSSSTAKSTGDKSKFENEIENLKALVETSEKNATIWQSKYRETVQSLDSMRDIAKELEQYQAREEDIEKRVKAVYEENVSLNSLVSEKMREIADYQELEGKVDVLIEENERLNKIIAEKKKEIENWIERYNDAKKQTSEGDIAKDEAANIRGEYLKTEAKLKVLLDENDKLNKILSETMIDSNEIKDQANRLIGENQQLREMLQTHYEDSEKWRDKCSQLETMQKNGENDVDYKTLAYDLDEKLRMLIDENEKLNSMLAEKAEDAKEFQYLEEKMEFLIQENDRLNGLINENSQWKEKYLNVEKKLQSIFKD